MKRPECVLFDGLADEEYEQLLKNINPREKKIPRGDLVYRYESDENELVILCDGVASIVKNDIDGNKILLKGLSKAVSSATVYLTASGRTTIFRSSPKPNAER